MEAAAGARSLALHIGMNRVDTEIYEEWLPELSAAHSDARAMRELADRFGCSSRLLRSEDATVQAVVDAMVELVDRAEPGDFVFVSFAGHGVTLRGVGDDADGWDEAWALYDGILLDDEFHEFLAAFPAGVDVLVVTDACFAAGIVDGLSGARSVVGPPQVSTDGQEVRIRLDSKSGDGGPGDKELLDAVLAPGTMSLLARAPASRLADQRVEALVRRGQVPIADFPAPGTRTPIKANLVSLAAASELELAFEGDLGGLFTTALLLAIDDLGDGPIGYLEVVDAAANKLSLQTPSIGLGGALAASNPAVVVSGPLGSKVKDPVATG